jgi:hypothetical protein
MTCLTARGLRFSVGLLLLSGCVEGPANNLLVPANAPGSVSWGQLPRLPTLPPATEETARRVGTIGQTVMLANPQIGMRPRFVTAGRPDEEIFHIGTREVVITEGLANRCTTDAQLAAVLAFELGRMVAEREAINTPAVRWQERQPPSDTTAVGNRNESYLAAPAADPTYLIEMAHYEEERRKPRVQGLPSPEAQARLFLRRAGYPDTALAEAAPLIQAADANGFLERQMRNQPAAIPQGGATLGPPAP